MNKESYPDSLIPDSSYISTTHDNRLMSSPIINPDDLFYPGTVYLTEYGSSIQKGLLHIQSLERNSDVNDPFAMSTEKQENELSEFLATADSLGMPTQIDYWRGVVLPQFTEAIEKRNNEIAANLITEHDQTVMDQSYPLIRYKDSIGEIISDAKKRINMQYQIFS
ncbi:MAG: hypothetical protein KatS3mg035_2135 [Bacteroidia bacterium]|nr:MAG: hypothetical protein KatS3mg035_2135 [Bacteroidia bacterium]